MTESGNNIRGGVLTGLAIVNIPLLRVFLGALRGGAGESVVSVHMSVIRGFIQ